MSRVKRGVVTKRRHKKVLKQTKGFWGQRGNVFKRAQETLLRSMASAFVGRKLKKRDQRSLFIGRVKAFVESHDMKYNQFIDRMKKKGILLNRKSLSQLFIHDSSAGNQLMKMI